MSSTIQVRVDDDLKIKSDNLFKELGTDTTTAIRMFLTQAVANNGFPFEIKKVAANPYIAISEKEVLDRLAKSRDQSKNGEYSEAGDFVADMRTKWLLLMMLKKICKSILNTSYMKKRISRQQEVCLMILNILKIY